MLSGHGFSISAPAIPIDSAGYYRLISFNGNAQTPWVKLDGLKYSEDQLYLLACRNSKWGVVTDSLQFCIPAEYDSIFSIGSYIFAESLFKLDIYQNNILIHSIADYESMEHKQHYRTEGDWKSLVEFKIWLEDTFIFKTLNGTFITDTTFRLESKNEYDDAFFMDEIIYTRRGDKFGFRSFENGEVVPVYKTIGMFNHLVVELKDDVDQRHYFLLDGRELPLSDSILQYFSESGYFKIYQNGKGNLYDHTLKPVINYEGDDIFNLQSVVEFPGRTTRNTNYYAFRINQSVGVCDENGATVLSPDYRQVFYGGKDRFIVSKDSLYGLVDATGSWILEPVYTFIETPGLEFFRVHDYEKKGIINKNGKVIVPVEFDEIYCSDRGILTQKDGRYGFYNFEGKRIFANDWSTVYPLSQNCYEMVSANGTRCVVNQKGAQTPLNCDNVYVGEETLKYYLHDRIVVIPFVNGVKLDSTVYPRNASVVVSRDHERVPMNINTFDCLAYRNQLNGKVGSKKKNNTGDAFPAAYDNLIDVGPRFVNETQSAQFYLAGHKFQTKETVISFFGESCNTHGNYLFYLRPDELGYWHSTSVDGTYSTSHEYDYAAENSFKSNEMVAMLVRKGFAVISLTAGDLNMQSGQYFSDFRPYYESMNSLHNLEIADVSTFGMLSTSPAIFAENPTWHVLTIFEKSDFRFRGSYKYYQRLESGGVIFSTDGSKYGIWFEGAKNIAEEIYSEIIPVAFGGYQYYLTNRVDELQDGTSVSQWTVFDNTGQVLPEFYDAISVKSFGFFEVVKGDQRFILGKSGEIIYTFS